MGFIDKTPGGKYKAFWRDPAGTQHSKTFALKKDATQFLAEIESSKTKGSYVSPHAGRQRFGDHAHRWMASRTTQATTAARDRSLMANHVLPRWGAVPLNKIDELDLQAWVSKLGQRLSAATVTRCLLLVSAVLRSAVRNRLISYNAAEGVRAPSVRRAGSALDQVISLEDLRARLLPEVPARHRGIIATAAGTGLRWGEAAGLLRDVVDLDRASVRVIRTIVEVAGHTSFKPFPKTAAGIRTVPLPGWLIEIIRQHLTRWPNKPNLPIFANEVGAPLRRGLFRARIWRPSLVRAGLLGQVAGEGPYTGRWTDADGASHEHTYKTYPRAVMEVARNHAGGMRFHDLRHSYATWLVDDGVPINMVQRVLGHEKSSTTLDIYTRRTDNSARILQALTDDRATDDDEGDSDDGGAAGALVPI